MASFVGLPVILSVVVMSLTSACSRRVTCVMEGCTKNGNVVLASDFASEEMPAQDADALPNDNSAVEKEIADIKARMDLNESATKLLSETMDLQEKRIAALEDKSKAVDEAMKDMGDRVTATEASIDAINEQLAALDLLLNGSDDASEEAMSLRQEIAELQASQLQMSGDLEALKDRVSCLERFRRNQEAYNRWLSSEVSTLCRSIKGLKDRIAEVESSAAALKEIVDSFTKSLEDIDDRFTDVEADVAEINRTMATDTELTQAKIDVTLALQGDIVKASDELKKDIARLDGVLADKCQFGNKVRDGLLWFREVNCGTGKTLRFLIL